MLKRLKKGKRLTRLLDERSLEMILRAVIHRTLKSGLMEVVSLSLSSLWHPMFDNLLHLRAKVLEVLGVKHLDHPGGYEG
jgi:uncharacterized protein with von Willebrand factor type A (vWA) domain